MKTHPKKLAGKVALVTGGSRGIGAGIATALANEGADVAISYVTSEKKADAVIAKLQLLGVRAVAFQADQADPTQVENLVKAVAAHFGRLDILVNNAGIAAMAPVDSLDFDPGTIARLHAINSTSVFVAIRAASRLMGEGGRIMAISSALANRASSSGFADYAASKAAIVGYCKGAARDLGPRKITVNIIACGAVNTDMNPENGPLADAQKSGTALARFGQPEEIGAGVAFLASDEASYITGTVLTIDGGLGA